MSITSRSEIKPQFDDLLAQEINSYEELVSWIKATDDLDSQLSQDYAWRYIATTVSTIDEEAKQKYMNFTQVIYPEWIRVSDQIGRKLIASEFITQLPSEYANFIRSVKHSVAMFREENVDLIAKEKEIESGFAEIMGALSVTYNGEELTMKQAEKYLKSDDRAVRKEVFELIEVRRYQDSDALDDMMTKLIEIRTQIARNCGFDTYTDYKFSYRYDYTKEQINQFHESIRMVITPIIQGFYTKKNEILKLDDIKPYDFDAPLMTGLESELFATTEEMIDKLCLLLHDMSPELEQFIRHMQEINNLDLETRKNKAPGGYNYPLSGTSDSFIFMNARRDGNGWFTWAHEAGHAIHHYLNRDLKLDMFRNCPSEIGEIASMAMELFTIDDLASIGCNTDQIKDALNDKIFKDIAFLPYMSKVDLMQQWMYDHPTHTHDERRQHWRQLNQLYPYSMRTGISDSWSGEYQDYCDTYWHRQMHFFECPFYYIEYGIAYLASVQLYNQFVINRSTAIANYSTILASGYVHSIPETMALGGVQFDVSESKLTELMQVMVDKYNTLF